MIQYVIFLGLLSVIYAGYQVIQSRERKRMKRYYGYTTRRRSENSLKKAA